MLAFLKSRAFLTVLGLFLLALFIWFFGPYIAFAGWAPLESVIARLIAIILVVGCWATLVLLKRMRANRASDKLIGEVVKQSQTGKEPASAEAQQLKERFEEAVATLKQKRKSGHSLYDLPWYVIIGAPGSGKTTALVNSGLNFPLEQRTGKGALRGVGGTRNCDWWFTDEAVLLDTAGRYTTQDSDAASDSAGWSEFLALLKKYRGRRPLNGVILTISAQDLLTLGQAEQEAHVLAARRRLTELNKELKIQLPVYVMVTKCDLVAGFTEYFEDLAQDGRAQVWGVTFPYELTTKGGAAEACPGEFDALIGRLNERVFARLEDERDIRRRTKIFAFPQQMAALRESLLEFVSEVFGATRFDQQILFRGLYFTSGTQQGNPVDRLLGAIGRRFAVAPDAAAPAAGKGRAYFIQRLLKDVLFAESGLAGVNRKTEALKATGQLGAYVAIGLFVVLSIVAWSVSYSRNQAYLTDVAAAAAKVEGASTAGASGLPIGRLDAIRAVYDTANAYRDSTPWLMRFGLYQGGALGDAAHDAYGGELNGTLLPLVADRFRQGLLSHAGEPEMVYEYLKAYLMLGDPAHLDKKQLATIADLEWDAAYANDPGQRAAVSKHFHFLLDNKNALRPIPLDASVVAQARGTIRQASKPGLVYRYLRIAYSDDTAGEIRLDQLAGIGAEQVLKRKSGIRLSEPVPSIYTKKTFEKISGKSTDEYALKFLSEGWVWGDSQDVRSSLMASADLSSKVIEIYEADYIAYWQRLVDDLQAAPASSLAQTKDALQTLSGATSPLRGLLKVVDENTFFTKPAIQLPTGGGVVDKIFQAGKRAIGAPASEPAPEPGLRITEHFASIHQLVAGAPGSAPIDGVLSKLGDLQQKMQPIGPSVGGTDPANPQVAASIMEAGNAVTRDARALPAGVGMVITQYANSAMGVVRGGVSTAVSGGYQQQVVQPCVAAIDGRYPFSPSAPSDVLLADFSRLFGAGGVYDEYFKNELERLVDTSRSPWAYRSYSSGESTGLPASMLQRFEQARRIRDIFFPGGKGLGVQFTVTPQALSDKATQFVLEVDGNPKLDYQHGPPRPLEWKWPGPGPEGVSVTFVGPGGNRPNLSFQGPWALFRLLDAGRVNRLSDDHFTLTLTAGGLEATIDVKSNSVLNPFVKATLPGFRCQ